MPAHRCGWSEERAESEMEAPGGQANWVALRARPRCVTDGGSLLHLEEQPRAMAIKCSLLGHSYGDPDVEREREQRGEEVVVTVRELKTCTRCGTELTVSENTEVRPVKSTQTETRQPDDAAATSPDSTPAEPAVSESEPPANEPPEPSTVAEEDADSTPTIVGGADGPLEEAGGSDDEFEKAQSAADDDGVILDEDGSSENSREPGEWPDAEDTRVELSSDSSEHPTAQPTPESAPPGSQSWPDEPAGSETGSSPAAGEPTNSDTGSTDEQTEILDAEEDSGTTTDSAASASSDIQRSTETPSERLRSGATGIESAGPVESSRGDPTSQLVCPSCEYEDSERQSSKRAGDICPSCGKGYLSERSNAKLP